MDFTGKTAIVTGGAQGIGLAIVNRFLSEGAVVYILDKTFPESFDPLHPDRVFTFTGDVSSAGDVSNCVAEAIQKSGRVEILVNNAGILSDNVIWHMPEEDFDKVIDVNLKGPWLMSREIVPVMRKQGYGRIINIASRSWLGNFGQSNYSASKGGLVSLTRVLALELARFNVTVNAVAPGLIDTPLTRSLPQETFEKLVALQPGNKVGAPADIASAVVFLASSEAGYINGQVLHVDGGKSIGSTGL